MKWRTSPRSSAAVGGPCGCRPSSPAPSCPTPPPRAPGTIPVGGVSTAWSSIPACTGPHLLLDGGDGVRRRRARRRNCRYWHAGQAVAADGPQGAQLRPPDAIMTAFEQILRRHVSAAAVSRDPFLLRRTRPLDRPYRARHPPRSRKPAPCSTRPHGGGGTRPPRALPADAGAQCLNPRRHPGRPGLLGRALRTIPGVDQGQPFRDPRADRRAPRARVEERFWNEHNFVFRKSNGLFYHAKGATRAFSAALRRTTAG